MKVTIISGTQGYVVENVIYLKIEDRNTIHMKSDGSGIEIIDDEQLGEDEEDV